MKRYSLIIILHIIAICLIAIGVYILAQKQLWFSAILACIALIILSIHLYRMQMLQLRMMRQLAESLRNDDMMLSFHAPYRNKAIEEMTNELTQSMNTFRARVLERNEMEAWQKLIRVLTHEIMNSITPILSLSETLSEREVTERNYSIMQQAMQTIHRRSKGLLEFVENYRKLTRLPAPARQDITVAELFNHIQKLFPEPYIHFSLPDSSNITAKQQQSNATNAAGNNHMQGSSPRAASSNSQPLSGSRVLNIDRGQIEQVLINLIRNAIEACAEQPDPRIEIVLQPSPAWQSIITVTDNGCGILPNVLDEVFVPFYTTKQQGSGIGLNLCKQIMTNHGGKISVHSTAGQGTCFTLQF